MSSKQPFVRLQQKMQKGNFISKSCSFYIRSENKPQILLYQSFSGLGENRLGRYYECLADENNEYFLIEAHWKNDFDGAHHSALQFSDQNLGKFLSNNFTTGFCFNKACTSADLQYGLQSASEYITLPFGIDRVTSPIDELPQWGLGTYFMLGFIGFLLLSCLVSTFLKTYFKRIKYKKEHIFIECFSLQNTIKLLSYKRNNLYDEIRVFSGVKFLAFMGIILSHMIMLLLKAPSSQFKQNLKMQVLYPFFYSADIWLSISGFFLSYIALKQYNQFQSIKIHLLRIARRFLRFWPIYIAIVMFTWKIAPFIGSGPLWGYAVKYFQNQCGAQILSYFFLVENFSENSCNSWLWIWQVDIQLCMVFNPLLLLYCCPTKKIWKIVFFSIQLIFLLCSMLIPSIYQNSNSIHYFFREMQFSSINISPATRMGSYMVGYNLGVIFFQFRQCKSLKENRLFSICSKKSVQALIAFISLLPLAGIFYYISTFQLEDVAFWQKVSLNSFHFIFPFSICMLISPSLFGFNSLFKKFLEYSKFGFLSKLSLSAYGVHFIIQIATIYSRKTDLYLNTLQIILQGLYSFLPIFFISIFFTALLEMPLYLAKKIYLKTPRITYFQH